MRDYIVTELQDGMRGLLAAALYEDRKLAMLRVGTFGSRSDVGTVVKGRVENTAKNIGGAFVCTDGRTGNVFLPTGASDPFGRVNASSPVLVQVVRDAAGIKRPVVTRNISLAGRYAVVSRRPGRISFSSKLTEEQSSDTEMDSEGGHGGISCSDPDQRRLDGQADAAGGTGTP
jgi:ribonuclease G